MAHSLSFTRLPLPPSFPSKLSSTLTPHLKFTPTKKPNLTIFKSIQDPNNSRLSQEPETQTPTTQEPQSDQLSELGAEIKKAMKESEQVKEESDDFWKGVGEEIGEIEWPAFNKVVSTTGVVLGVIAGSSVVLLTVNAVLSELSDQLFAGRGFQDFFG
ncbi:preprotein translocase subunit SECE1 [Apium graveolens]|uniref:preprotein translocase subunit SECE1 n=1 Tax=Apium graveolens TaxID=4045 RepID=UPI003D793D55